MNINKFRQVSIREKRLIVACILMLCVMSFSLNAQSIERVFGNDCQGFSNEFQFSCGSLSSGQCSFTRWEITGNYTKQYDDAGILDVYWNSAGPVTVKAHYFSATLGYELNVLFNLTITSPVTPAVSLSIVSTPASVCSNSSIQFSATPTQGGGSSYYNWYVNNMNKANGSSNSFTWSNWSNSDVVTVRMTSSINCLTTSSPVVSNGVTVIVTTPPIVSLEIGYQSLCASSSQQSIYAMPNNGGSNPQYAWYKNGIGVNSSEIVSDQYGSNYTPAGVLQPGDQIYCTVISNASCSSSIPVSSEIVTVYQGIPPNITITPDKISICNGDAVTFTLSADYPTTSVYTISYNGTIQSLAAGVNQFTIPAYQSNNNYDINATVTVSGSCLSTTNPTKTFQASQITVSSIPEITTVPSGALKICSTCTQSINVIANGSNQYQWYWNGSTIPGATLTSYSASQVGTYTVSAKQGTCPMSTSLPFLLTMNSAPFVSTGATAIITLPKNSITLNGTASDIDGTIQSYSWTKIAGGLASLSGENTAAISLTNLEAGSYILRLMVTDNFGESSSADVSIKVKNAPNYLMESTLMIAGYTSDTQLTNLSVGQMAVNITYVDGLGRIMQKVHKQASPGSKDIVQPVAYDEFGRESSQYLPYVDSDNTGAYKVNSISDQTSFYNGSISTISNSSKPYSKVVFEPSPLSRVMKQGAFGEAWQPIDGDPYSVNDRTIKKRSEPNQASDFILILNYDNTNRTVLLPSVSNIYFDANSLLANSTYDELNNSVIEFVDKLGRMICKKVQSGGTIEVPEFASTYYIYDDFGNLVMVLPPEGVEKLKTALNLN